jgi:hypothetical protein
VVKLSLRSLWARDDLSVVQKKWTNESGWLDLWALPRGYSVNIAQTRGQD